MTLNELLVEWSYRTEKGYPDLGNPSDILILKEILESLDLPFEEIIPNLKEGTKAANTRKAIDIILQYKYAKEHGFKKMSNTYRIGNLDGIESDGKGAYFVTDWTGAKLYRIKKNGKFKVIAEVGKGAADHEVILDKNLVIIPIMAEGKVIALKVK